MEETVPSGKGKPLRTSSQRSTLEDSSDRSKMQVDGSTILRKYGRTKSVGIVVWQRRLGEQRKVEIFCALVQQRNYTLNEGFTSGIINGSDETIRRMLGNALVGRDFCLQIEAVG